MNPKGGLDIVDKIIDVGKTIFLFKFMLHDDIKKAFLGEFMVHLESLSYTWKSNFRPLMNPFESILL